MDLVLSEDEKRDLLRSCRVQIFKYGPLRYTRARYLTIISVWRPISKVVENWPLTVCDARTVRLNDLEELELLTEGKVRLSYLAKWSDKFRFYYLSQMTDREVCIFKIFDSAAWGGHAADKATRGSRFPRLLRGR